MGRGFKPNAGLREKFRVVFSPEASNEILKAYLWYKMEQPGLEKKFREQLSIKIESIKQNPKASSFIYKDVRSAISSLKKS